MTAPRSSCIVPYGSLRRGRERSELIPFILKQGMALPILAATFNALQA